MDRADHFRCGTGMSALPMWICLCQSDEGRAPLTALSAQIQRNRGNRAELKKALDPLEHFMNNEPQERL
jgi:hypothetical protein